MITLSAVTKSYGPDADALRDVSLEIGKGEFVCLAGPSGAGKSTLLRLLLREEVASSGQVLVAGTDLATLGREARQAYRRTVGFVFQDFRLLPERTIFENVATVARVMGQSRAHQWRRASALLQQVGLQHRMESFPLQLSGGEQQRVAIARALMNEPAILLADEPTGNLDRALSLEVMDVFRAINASGTTVVMATHDQDIIDYVNRRVVQLDRGQVVGDRRPA
ncbi:cell division ATP-binding protein FtsE [Luteitalea sp. TBR-22]|uniref:cell division ATP-binding protein FtsE n=1 Tax=Luteitalea sp. TBR-22 TaxID=2802971 RepID=UPI001AFBE998|nr:cell division ATP-binding protein FtsE [Luteitalea sp. TBR-22]BCS33929.1 cell division ATP-binding protein FtsE [Luteitalea sp. TBR-22]